ncbi:MAG: DEAD/DEAH box helicase family protein, partial [Defluviitaleaceae bacterium]|nr:DEAD/DEAH box helicase family protein [Defluviitaleaceae bacterium]
SEYLFLRHSPSYSVFGITWVTTDILFLQKRDRPLDIEPDWIHLGQTEDDIPINRYFLDNPEMMLGTMVIENSNRLYGAENSASCKPFESADLGEQLRTALFNVRGQITEVEHDDIDGIDNHAIPADPRVRNFSYALVTPAADGDIFADKIGEGQVYFRENSVMFPVDLLATTLERVKGMVAIRDCTHELIALQLDERGEDEIKAKQGELNTLYDSFTKDYGLLNSTANNRAFSADNSYYLLSSLEVLDEDNKLKRKADMFSKRTIRPKVVITKVDTASEALAVSLAEKGSVDIEYMSQLTGKSEDAVFAELPGVIYKDYHYFADGKYTYRTADEFLSGDIRKKLDFYGEGLILVENDPDRGTISVDIAANIAALQKVMPKDLEAHEISVRLGSTWIDKQYVQDFMNELLPASKVHRRDYQVNYFPRTGEWQVAGKGKAIYSDIHATVTYGTERANAYEILDDTLNMRDIRVYNYVQDAEGKTKRVLDKKETTLAQQKQEMIKREFKEWIWKDPQRRQDLVKLYNERFNSTRPREYDGSHLKFPGMSPEIVLRPHQLNAIARVIYGGNTLLAHVVGAGKTYTMTGAAMELKRLELSHKPMLCVPNHLTEQWASAFLQLYPAANILVARKKDFEMRNRKKFCAKIATGEYDAVIIGHSQLEKIPLSKERQRRLLDEQISEIEEGIRELEGADGDRFTIKQMERTKKSLELHLAKVIDSKKKDDVVTFEQLGVDRLFVDESHYYKELCYRGSFKKGTLLL